MAYGQPTLNNPFGQNAVNAIAEPEATAYYCTTADIVARIGQLQLARLTSDNVNATTPDAVKVAAAILRGATYIDAQIQDIYSTPLISVPQIIRDMNTTFAIYYLMSGRFSELAMPKVWKDQYDEACSALLEIASLDMTLPNLDPIISPASQMSTHNRPFGRRHEQFEQF